MSLIVDPALHWVPIAVIVREVPRVRSDWRQGNDQAALEEMTSSIRALGVLQPILLSLADDAYRLVCGGRRLIAAERAGLRVIPARVCSLPTDHYWVAQLVENLQRHDPSDADVNRALWTAHVRGGMPVPLIAALIHRSARYVERRIAIAGDAVLSAAQAEGRITLACGEILLRLATWFTAPRIDDLGEERAAYRAHHEPAALLARLERGGRVEGREARELLDHYERWCVPHDAHAYRELVERDRRLHLPYLAYVDRARYLMICEDSERLTIARHMEGEALRERAAAERDLPYTVAPPAEPGPRPTVATIAPFAPAAGRPSPDAAAIPAGSGDGVASPRSRAGAAHPLAAADVGSGACRVESAVSPPLDVPQHASGVDEDPPDFAIRRLLRPLDRTGLLAVEALARYASARRVDWYVVREACRILRAECG